MAYCDVSMALESKVQASVVDQLTCQDTQAGGRRISGKQPIITAKQAAASKQWAAHRPYISPSLLSVLQTVMLPIGVASTAVVAKVLYFGPLLHSGAQFSFYLCAGLLGAIIMSQIAGQTDLRSTRAIIGGQAQMRLVITAACLSFDSILCIFYLFKIPGRVLSGQVLRTYKISHCHSLTVSYQEEK